MVIVKKFVEYWQGKPEYSEKPFPSAKGYVSPFYLRKNILGIVLPKQNART
jgi:hypothetical protein